MKHSVTHVGMFLQRLIEYSKDPLMAMSGSQYIRCPDVSVFDAVTKGFSDLVIQLILKYFDFMQQVLDQEYVMRQIL